MQEDKPPLATIKKILLLVFLGLLLLFAKAISSGTAVTDCTTLEPQKSTTLFFRPLSPVSTPDVRIYASVGENALEMPLNSSQAILKPVWVSKDWVHEQTEGMMFANLLRCMVHREAFKKQVNGTWYYNLRSRGDKNYPCGEPYCAKGLLSFWQMTFDKYCQGDIDNGIDPLVCANRMLAENFAIYHRKWPTIKLYCL